MDLFNLMLLTEQPTRSHTLTTKDYSIMESLYRAACGWEQYRKTLTNIAKEHRGLTSLDNLPLNYKTFDNVWLKTTKDKWDYSLGSGITFNSFEEAKPFFDRLFKVLNHHA